MVVFSFFKGKILGMKNSIFGFYNKSQNSWLLKKIQNPF
jgi:hypothetical protein